jgi:nitroreductase
MIKRGIIQRVLILFLVVPHYFSEGGAQKVFCASFQDFYSYILIGTKIRREIIETNALSTIRVDIKNQDETEYTPHQKFFFDIMKKRRTVRKFKSESVPKEHILKIIELASSAPTAGNQQPWKFLVIQDIKKLDLLKKEALSWYIEKYKKRTDPSPDKLSEIQQRVKKSLKGILSAPVYVIVLVDSTGAKYPQYVLYDGILAAGYLMIAARCLGYGTGFFKTFFPEDEMKQLFNIPEKYKLICFTPIGIPYEWPETPIKKKVDEIIVFDTF